MQPVPRVDITLHTALCSDYNHYPQVVPQYPVGFFPYFVIPLKKGKC